MLARYMLLVYSVGIALDILTSLCTIFNRTQILLHISVGIQVTRS